MKNILLLVHDDSGQEARFQVALDVTRTLQGHLTCVDVTEYPSFPYACPDGVVAGLLLQEEQVREAANKTRVQTDLANELVPWTWKDATGSIAQCLRDAATMADLIVVSRKLDDFPIPDMVAAASELVLTAEKPLLLVPDASKRLDLFGTALIAWDGSAQATSALRAAIPLLGFADRVVLVEVDGAAQKLTSEDAATYLSENGITAMIDRRPHDGDAIASVLLKAVRDHRADYLVMGGFSHQRWIQLIFGGVTRTMLEDCPVPVLMAH